MFFQLETTEQKPYLDLLKLFAYGTYTEYKSEWSLPHGHTFLSLTCLRSARKDQLPELNPQQLTKLKQLTIVSLASTNKVRSTDFSFVLQLLSDIAIATFFS